MGLSVNSSIESAVGEKVRFYRITAGMKQRDLAKILGISYQQVQKYETGKDKISISRLHDISDALEIPLMSFIGEGEVADISHSRQTLRLMEYFSAISDERSRQLVVDVVKSLAEKSASCQSSADEARNNDHDVVNAPKLVM